MLIASIEKHNEKVGGETFAQQGILMKDDLPAPPNYGTYSPVGEIARSEALYTLMGPGLCAEHIKHFPKLRGLRW